MRTFLCLLFGFFLLGAGFGIFDAEDNTERIFDAIVASVGACGMTVMGYIEWRKDPLKFKRLLGLQTFDWKEAGIAFALTAALPVLVYWLIERTLHVRTDNQQMLAVALAVAGMACFAIHMSD